MLKGESQDYHISNRLEMTPFNSRLILDDSMHNDYANPLILDKMISYYDLDEIGTNYPKEMYNPYGKDPQDFYEEIAKR